MALVLNWYFCVFGVSFFAGCYVWCFLLVDVFILGMYCCFIRCFLLCFFGSGYVCLRLCLCFVCFVFVLFVVFFF